MRKSSRERVRRDCSGFENHSKRPLALEVPIKPARLGGKRADGWHRPVVPGYRQLQQKQD